MDDKDQTARESHLLAACTRLTTSEADASAIRLILGDAIDWTRFAQTAIESGLVSRAAHTLVRVAPDMIPHDVLEAMREVVRRVRHENQECLTRIAESAARLPVPGSHIAIERGSANAAAALTDNPTDAVAWCDLAQVLFDLRRFHDSVACCRRAVALAPDYAPAWRDLARALSDTSQRATTLPYIDKALELDPTDAASWTRRAYALADLQRYDEALDASDRALALDPGRIAAARIGIHSVLFVCDWRRREAIKRQRTEGVDAGQRIISPFNNLVLSDSEAENLAVARIWAKTVPAAATPLWNGERYQHDRIRIAYISTDFRDTLAVNAIAGCFEGHDKSRFETTAISLNPDDGSDTRRRIVAAFDRFVDAETMGSTQVSALLRDCEIDIAIDLNGYAGDARTEIVAARPAPIQVNYLGYAGTTGMPFIDYIIADRVVIPEQHRMYYSENVVYLPHSFFPIDRQRRIAEHTPTRTEAGLPEAAFIFACHNTPYKITPEIFDVWMRLLLAVDGSVLWLSSAVDAAVANLRREAVARGVAPERLLFGPRVPRREDHLARLRLADLFLDTLPFNGHTTACDALWAGLPVLTCMGTTFPARVAASQLQAAGLPELVTTSPSEYESLAQALAQTPGRITSLKEKLKHNREIAPLFDTALFTRHLESAFITMWEHHQRGFPPTGFSVPPIEPPYR